MTEQAILVALIALAGVVVTALVTWLIAERRIVTRHITSERATWRHRIRQNALEVHDALVEVPPAKTARVRLRMEFRALLNPVDDQDHAILECIAPVASDKCEKCRAEQFATRVALLLKHDWDRAKLEAGFPPCRWFLRAKRTPLLSEDKCLDCDICSRTVKSSSRRKYEFRRLPVLCLVVFLLVLI